MSVISGSRSYRISVYTVDARYLDTRVGDASDQTDRATRYLCSTLPLKADGGEDGAGTASSTSIVLFISKGLRECVPQPTRILSSSGTELTKAFQTQCKEIEAELKTTSSSLEVILEGIKNSEFRK
nr:digalactosyldiacylglycerol synthase 1, chloroplastic [Ipomoea batatas]